MDPNTRLTLDLIDMKVWMDRIYEAIDQSIVITVSYIQMLLISWAKLTLFLQATGQTISLANEKGIDILGDIVEGSIIQNVKII